MKKTLLIILSAVFVLVSCEKNTEKGEALTTYPLYYSATEYDGDVKSGGTGKSVATISYSELDEVIIDITTDPSIATVDVYSDATTVGSSVTLSAGAGTLNATLAAMGIPDVGDNNYIGLHYEFDGKKANEAAYVKQVSPWSVTTPTIIDKDMVDTLWWEVETANAVVSDVTISVSVDDGAATVYTDQGIDNFMEFDGANYDRKDTIKVTMVATSGSKTSQVKASWVVQKWAFGDGAEGVVLEDGADPYDVEELEFAAGAHLALNSTVGNVGFAGTNVDFVVSDKATYADNDVNITMADYAAGTPVATVANANIDDVFIFKTDTDVYGLMIVTDKKEFTDPTKSTLTVDIMIL